MFVLLSTCTVAVYAVCQQLQEPGGVQLCGLNGPTLHRRRLQRAGSRGFSVPPACINQLSQRALSVIANYQNMWHEGFNTIFRHDEMASRPPLTHPVIIEQLNFSVQITPSYGIANYRGRPVTKKAFQGRHQNCFFTLSRFVFELRFNWVYYIRRVISHLFTLVISQSAIKQKTAPKGLFHLVLQSYFGTSLYHQCFFSVVMILIIQVIETQEHFQAIYFRSSSCNPY